MDEIVKEQAEIISLMKRHDRPMTWLESEKNKKETLEKLQGCWFTNEEYQQYLAEDVDKSELMPYTRLSKSITGLDVTVYLPQISEWYKPDHPLWVYVENSETPTDDFFPMSISENPQVLVSGYKLNITEEQLGEVKRFIANNLKFINEYAKTKISTINENVIRNDGKTISEWLDEPKEMLLEYFLTLTPQEAGLDIPVWIDMGSTYMSSGHGPRIKIPGSPDVVRNTREWSSITISDDPVIFNLPKRKTYGSDVLNSAIDFVKRNKDLLMKVAQGVTMTPDEFKQSVKK